MLKRTGAARMDESKAGKQQSDDVAPPGAGTTGPMGAMEPSSGSAAPAPIEPPMIARSVGPMGAIEDVDDSRAPEIEPAKETVIEVGIEPEVQPTIEIAPEPAAPLELAEPVSVATFEEQPFAAERTALLPSASSETSSESIADDSIPMIAPMRVEAVGWRWFYIPVLMILAGFVFVAGRYQGWELRKYVYLWSNGMHWGDATNAYNLYGKGALDHGIFQVYQKIKSGEISDEVGKLDYPPLRLTVLAKWRQWGNEQQIQRPYPFFQDAYVHTEPMLQLNMACEIVSAILIFLLIRMWTLRARRLDEPNPGWFWPVIGFAVCEGAALSIFAINKSQVDPWAIGFFYLGAVSLAGIIPGIAPALAGALLFWFNPAVIWNAYAWPQWDVWLFPFMLGAILLASTECWFGAGMLIAVGALLKGQLLLVSPLFLLWPLFRGQWKQMIHFVGGFAITFGAIVFPWMLPSTNAKVWIGLVALGLLLISPFTFRMKVNRTFAIIAALVAIPVIWPWGSGAGWSIRFCIIGIFGLVALAHFAPRWLVPSVYAIALAAAIFLMIPLYNASNAWYTQGYKFGSEKFMEIGTTVTGNGGTSYTNNLPVLLQRIMQWPNHAEQATIDLSWVNDYGLKWLGLTTVTARKFMFTIYAICLVLCGIGASIHARRRDPRLLACAVAPWLLSFVLLTQLNNRYLVWAAGMSALLPAVGLGMTLLGIIVSILAWIGMAQLQYTRFTVDPGMAQLIDPLSPHVGWMLTLAAAVYLYVAIVPGSRSRQTSL